MQQGCLALRPPYAGAMDLQRTLARCAQQVSSYGEPQATPSAATTRRPSAATRLAIPWQRDSKPIASYRQQPPRGAELHGLGAGSSPATGAQRFQCVASCSVTAGLDSLEPVDYLYEGDTVMAAAASMAQDGQWRVMISHPGEAEAWVSSRYMRRLLPEGQIQHTPDSSSAALRSAALGLRPSGGAAAGHDSTPGPVLQSGRLQLDGEWRWFVLDQRTLSWSSRPPGLREPGRVLGSIDLSEPPFVRVGCAAKSVQLQPDGEAAGRRVLN